MRYTHILSLILMGSTVVACTGSSDDTPSPSPALSASFSADLTEGPAPLLVNFTDTSASPQIDGWLWQFGDGATSQDRNPSHIYAQSGAFTVTLEVFSGEQRAEASQVDYILVTDGTGTPSEPLVTPTPEPTGPSADFDADPREGYAPLTVQFEDESKEGDGQVEDWSWMFGDGGVSEGQNPIHTYQSPGIYTVTLAVETDVGSDTITKGGYITVFAEPDKPVPEAGSIVIHELLANPAEGQGAWVEFHNITESEIDLSGWLLSDDELTLQKFTLPEGSVIPGGGYLVLHEAETFGDGGHGGTSQVFNLSAFGGDLILASATAGEPTGYLETEDYGPSHSGISFGRHEKSTQTFNFVAMAAQTPGEANGEPRVGPVVISEVYYDPANNEDLEFVELLNISDGTVDLGSGWRFDDGIEFVFPPETLLEPGAYLVVARAPDILWGSYEDGTQTFTALGPYAGKLSNNGESVELASPGPVDENGLIHTVRMDRVKYDIATPWPEEPAGGGASLNRIEVGDYGNDPINWQGAIPSPGQATSDAGAGSGEGMRINEIMYHPASEDEREEFIELLNTGDETVYLLDWSFTDGITFTFPALTVAPGQYLIIAADVSTFIATHGSPDGAILLGGFDSKLSDKGEVLTLSNARGEPIDALTYADEGPWSERWLGEEDFGHQGYIWLSEHDGLGKSLERQSLRLPTDHGMNWRSSVNLGGSPGRANGVVADDMAPLIRGLSHEPLIPAPGQAIGVEVQVIDDFEAISAVRLYYRLDGEVDFESLLMTSTDGTLWQGTIPPGLDGEIYEYYVQAEDASGLIRSWPAPVEPDHGHWANHLIEISADLEAELASKPASHGYCRIVMTEAQRAQLEDIGNGVDEEGGVIDEEYSNAEMNAAYYCQNEDGGIDARFLVGVRNRGASSRSRPPNNYRVNFRHDQPYQGVTAININSKWPYSQVIGAKLWEAAGLPAARARGLQLRVNGENLALNDPDMYGAYAQVDALNSEFVAANFAKGDRDGNLYRGKNAADLIFLGEGSGYYHGRYVKQTNEALADWSDVTHLTWVLSEAPDAGYLEAVAEVMVIDQWLRHFALDTLVNNIEGGLCTGKGDDYAIFAGIDDTRFWLLPHDLDSLFGNPQPYADLRITGYADVPGLSRLFALPEFEARYYGHIMLLLDTLFTPENVSEMMEIHLGDWVDPEEIEEMQAHMRMRIDRVQQQMFWQHVVPFGTQWTYWSEAEAVGTDWQSAGFDDGAWDTGTAPLGYGNGNEVTVVDYGEDPANKPITTYFRTTFEIDNPQDFEALRFYLVRDDGAVVYLNGQEVYRSNMPDGEIDSQTVASEGVKSADESVIHEALLSPEFLQAGENTLAVEVHLIGPASADMRMDANLVAKPYGAETYTEVTWEPQ